MSFLCRSESSNPLPSGDDAPDSRKKSERDSEDASTKSLFDLRCWSHSHSVAGSVSAPPVDCGGEERKNERNCWSGVDRYQDVFHECDWDDDITSFDDLPLDSDSCHDVDDLHTANKGLHGVHTPENRGGSQGSDVLHNGTCDNCLHYDKFLLRKKYMDYIADGENELNAPTSDASLLKKMTKAEERGGCNLTKMKTTTVVVKPLTVE